MEASNQVEATHHEGASLEERQTWEVSGRPKGYPTGFGQWVFGRKIGPTGEISRDEA